MLWQSRLALAFFLTATGVCAGCDRNLEPYVPGEKPRAPDLSRIFPEGAERAATQADSRQANRRTAGPAASESEATPRGAPPNASESIAGIVRLSPELADRVPSGAVLFLIARREGSGPPVAVRRIANPHFPFPFELGPADRMIPTLPFTGPLHLSARLDSDGNAITRSPGDLQGQTEKGFPPGSKGVTLVIDQSL